MEAQESSLVYHPFATGKDTSVSLAYYSENLMMVYELIPADFIQEITQIADKFKQLRHATNVKSVFLHQILPETCDVEWFPYVNQGANPDNIYSVIVNILCHKYDIHTVWMTDLLFMLIYLVENRPNDDYMYSIDIKNDLINMINKLTEYNSLAIAEYERGEWSDKYLTMVQCRAMAMGEFVNTIDLVAYYKFATSQPEETVETEPATQYSDVSIRSLSDDQIRANIDILGEKLDKLRYEIVNAAIMPSEKTFEELGNLETQMFIHFNELNSRRQVIFDQEVAQEKAARPTEES